MRITIPFKTPSINHLYFNYRNVRILTKEARQLKKDIFNIVDKIEKTSPFSSIPLPSIPLKVTTKIYEDWYYKNSKIRTCDIANREKFLIDAIFDALGVDDKYIFEQHLIKVQSDDKEFAEIEINAI